MKVDNIKSKFSIQTFVVFIMFRYFLVDAFVFHGELKKQKNVFFLKSKFSSLTFRYIKIKEITIENCLNNPGYNRNPIKKILHIITINPVKYIKESIYTQCK
jgi:hypothetical protein